MLNFLYKLRFIIIFIVLAIVLILWYNQYKNIKTLHYSRYEKNQELIEERILGNIERTDMSYQVVNDILEREMKEYSEIMQEKYRQNPDISSWNLEELKREFGGDYEIYLVNSDLVVEETTYDKDLGLDFKQFPSFAQLLKKRMEGNKFTSDRLDVSINTGDFIKYSYMPTPDNEYLLELSVDINEQFPILENMDIISVSENLKAEYDIVNDIFIYKFSDEGTEIKEIRDLSKSSTPMNISDEKKEIIRKSIIENQRQSINNLKNSDGTENMSTFVPYLTVNEDNNLNWWNSYVVEVAYDIKGLNSALTAARNNFLHNSLFIIAVFLILTGMLKYLFEEREKAEKKIRYMAYYDATTGLGNKDLFTTHSQEIINRAVLKDNIFSVMYIDVDNFKNINDRYGHNSGDYFLKEIGIKIREVLRETDEVYRIGGDEFAILLDGIGSKQDAFNIASRIVDNFKKPFNIEGQEIKCRLSIGISFYPDDGTDIDSLLKNADKAMYAAKEHKSLAFKAYSSN